MVGKYEDPGKAQSRSVLLVNCLILANATDFCSFFGILQLATQKGSFRMALRSYRVSRGCQSLPEASVQSLRGSISIAGAPNKKNPPIFLGAHKWCGKTLKQNHCHLGVTQSSLHAKHSQNPPILRPIPTVGDLPCLLPRLLRQLLPCGGSRSCPVVALQMNWH